MKYDLYDGDTNEIIASAISLEEMFVNGDYDAEDKRACVAAIASDGEYLIGGGAAPAFIIRAHKAAV
jgi:hypothetical protein